MDELERFLTEFLPQQEKAEKAIHDGIAQPRIDLWSRNDPVTLFGAAVPCTRSNARARSPTSSFARTSTGSSGIGPEWSSSPSAIFVSSDSATCAIRSADRVSRVSGRATVRATAMLSRTPFR